LMGFGSVLLIVRLGWVTRFSARIAPTASAPRRIDGYAKVKRH